MRGLFGLAAATLATFIAQSTGHPIVVHPGGVKDVQFNEENVLNSTAGPDTGYWSNSTTADSTEDKVTFIVEAAQASNSLPVSLVNNYGDNMFAFMTGKDASGTPVFIDNTGNYYYPEGATSTATAITATNIAIALGGQGSTTTINIPGDLISARIYLAQGQLQFYTVLDGNGVAAIVEPAAVNPADASAGVAWGFVEFNYQDNSIFTNISYVDFVGLPLGMALSDAANTQIVEGLTAGALQSICNDLIAQAAADGQAWDQLCQTDASGNALRVLSPNLYTSANPTWMSTYYDAYVQQVWEFYASNTLTINTQSQGDSACQVVDNQLNCANDNRAFPAPTTADIWGCNSGPFAIIDGDNPTHVANVPRLCAAFERTELLLDGGSYTPSLDASNYYTVDPTNHYSRIVHNYEANGIGYAFSYDDVNPEGANASGEITTVNPTSLKITVGGYS
ncbi:glycoside hydrolase family 64 protein [Xylariaceae sp. FL1019]|nr:glycoside hydrolase family 64 protein [Xylariaceae sp. FL1019]